MPVPAESRSPKLAEVILLAVILSISLFQPLLPGQDGESAYPLRQIHIPQLQPSPAPCRLDGADGDGLLIGASSPTSLSLWRISPQSEASAPRLLLSEEKGSLDSFAALMVGDKGLAFAVVKTGGGGTRAVIYSVLFDAKGKAIGGTKRLFTIKDDLKVGISAAAGPASVGLVVTAAKPGQATNFGQGYLGSKLWLLETDFQGNLLTDPFELAQPDDGKLTLLTCSQPAWLAERWLIPACRTYFKQFTVDENLSPIDSLITLGNDLLLISAQSPRRSDPSFSILTLATDTEALFPSFRSSQILPFRSRTSAEGNDFACRLLVQQIRLRQGEERRLDLFDSTFFIQPIEISSENGVAASAPIPVDMPAWHHGITLTPDKVLDETSYLDALSAALAHGQERLLLTRTRSLALIDSDQVVVKTADAGDCEGRLDLLELDPETGEVENLATLATDKAGAWSPPLLGRLGGLPAVLHLLTRSPAGNYAPPECSAFISVFKSLEN